MVEGLDVSTYQGAINWAKIPTNFRCVFIRAVKGTVIDPHFIVNWDGARNRGFPYRLAYAYLTPGDARQQAESLLSFLGDLERGEGIMLDFEDPHVAQQEATTWLNTVERYTKRPAVVYLGGTLALKSKRLLVVGNRPLVWPVYRDEDYARGTLNSRNWDAWQFTDKGSVPGIVGPVDLDRIDAPSMFAAAVGGAPMIYEPASWATVAGGCQPGVSAFWLAMLELMPDLLNSGCYNDRGVTGNTGTASVHREGRGRDLGIGQPGSVGYDDRKARLWPFLRQIRANYEALGCQMIIFDRHIWSCSRDAEGWRYFGAGNGGPHQDHAHVEFQWFAARTLIVDRVLALLRDEAPPPPPPHPIIMEDEMALIRKDGKNAVWATNGVHRRHVSLGESVAPASLVFGDVIVVDADVDLTDAFGRVVGDDPGDA